MLPSTKFLSEITDDFGVWQHTHNREILREEGYALDDSARGLIVFLLYGELEKAEICFNYLETSFVEGKFVGFFSKDREVLVYPSSEDAANLAYLALAFCLEQKFLVKKVSSLIRKVNLPLSSYIRSLSYRLIAESWIRNKSLANDIANVIAKRFDEKIMWFEPTLTYANALMPYALLVYLNNTNTPNQELESLITSSMATLEKNMRVDNLPTPVSNKSPHKVGTKIKEVFGQQPIDAAFMVLMYSQGYKLFKQEKFLNLAKEWMTWFVGNNICQKSLIFENTACADGIDDTGISQNFGSESTIMFLWASYAAQNSLVK